MAVHPVVFFLQFNRQASGAVVAGHHAQHPAQLLDGVMNALRVHEKPRAHGVGGYEKMAMASFKMSSSCTRRLLAARRVRTSAASAESAGKSYGALSARHRAA